MTLNSVAARTPDNAKLFENLNLSLGRERAAVVGRNGVGKTTLLRLIVGLGQPSDGQITRTGSVGYLAQNYLPLEEETLADTLGVSGPLAVLRRVLAGNGSVEDMAQADWGLEERLHAAMDGMGLKDRSLDQLSLSLSGGELTRLRLAGLLLKQPDLLLLDEPTNHLDHDARTMVRSLIDGWRGGLLVVSHDRDLLRSMDLILELSSQGIRSFGGNWDDYVVRRDSEREAAVRQLDQAQRAVGQARREIQVASERKARRDRVGRANRDASSDPKILMDARAQRAEESAARDSRLAERKRAQVQAQLSEAEARVMREDDLNLMLVSPDLPASRLVLDMDEAIWHVPGSERHIGPLSLRLTGPERVAISGPNGSGKSTLLRIIEGSLKPDEGKVNRPVKGVRLDQDNRLLNTDQSLLSVWMGLNPKAGLNEAHVALARFNFRNEAAKKLVSSLSGGERLRAGLACVMAGSEPAPLLLLDEPTNHLDLDAIEALERVLKAYRGALVVVSHDEDFLAAIGITRRLRL